MHKTYNIITAFSKNRGIGYNNKLPWNYIKKDMDMFKEITCTVKNDNNYNKIIMGRNTWESLKKPLSNRLNVIVSSKLNITGENIMVARSFEEAVNYTDSRLENSFVIGGEQIYNQALRPDLCKRVFTTEIDKEYVVDTYFPELPAYFKLAHEMKNYDDKENVKLNFKIYENISNINSEEYEYLNILKDIMDNGEYYMDRTGTGVISLFDKNMNFSIPTMSYDGTYGMNYIYTIPLLTTKKMFTRGIIEELLWFLRGGTNAKELQEKKVHIWDGNTSREFLDSRGLDYEEGEIGPGYGHQWVNWGGNWRTGKGGINQIKNIIELLRNDPTSRRAILTAWNVSDLDKMALPPCHMTYVFNISGHPDNKRLNCKVLLRSNDMFLGSPFNILSTSILTILMSRAIGVLPGNIALSIVDAHVYSDHIEQVNEQLKRVPLNFPNLTINKKISSYNDILSLKASDFELTNYNSWSSLKGKMAI